MAIEVGEIVATLKADTKGFEQAMQKSNASIVALGAGSVALGNIASQAFSHVAAGAINAATSIIRWTGEVAMAVERTENLSMQLGVSERTLEAWGMVATDAGLNIETMAGGMRTLSKHLEGLGSGSEKSVELFNKLAPSMTVTEAASLSTEQAIGLIADRFADMPDGAEKSRLAIELLGRAGLQMIPILNGGSAALASAAKEAEKLNVSLSTEQRAHIKVYDRAVDALSNTLQGFKNQVAAAFAPSLTKNVEWMTSAVSYAKSIFTAFADAAEKLFIRIGAMSAAIQLFGQQLFSMSVLNKEAWQQTIEQIKAIDSWAAAQLKAVDAGKNAEVQMAATNTQTKEYTVSQQKLGEAIVAATQIQIKQHQEAKDAVMARMAAEIELGERQKQYAADVSKQVFTEIFAEEERQRKEAYGGSAVMIANVTAKTKALADMHGDLQAGIDAATQAYIEQGMAADAALMAETAAAVQADKNNEAYQGKFIVTKALAKESASEWANAMKIINDSAAFAFGSIRAQFANTVVGLVQGTATWKDFWKSASGSILNSVIQMGINMVAAMAVKNAAILLGETTTATGVTTIWGAASASVLGAFGAMTAGIATFFTSTIIPMFAAVGEAVMTFLAAIATSLDISIFGAPFSVPVWAAVGLVAAAVGVISAFAFGAFAEGGVITKPTMALMGEAGPEAVIPLSKLGQFGGGGETTVIVELDGRQIAKSVFQNMPGVMRLRGMTA